jgi:hypothetical protein
MQGFLFYSAEASLLRMASKSNSYSLNQMPGYGKALQAFASLLKNFVILRRATINRNFYKRWTSNSIRIHHH